MDMQLNLLNLFKRDVVDEIKSAAKDVKTVMITYRDSKSEITKREGEPYEIKDNGLYMYCYEKDNIRLFKLERILEAKKTRNSFNPKWPIKIV